MADISKISPDGGTTEYNIKDATARSGKADKVASATNGNFAGLDANGNLTDSGKKASDFATADDVASRVPWSANAETGVHNFFIGKNADCLRNAGITVTNNSDGTLSLGAGTTTSEIPIPDINSYNNCYNLKPNTTYKFTGKMKQTNLFLQVFYKETSSSEWTRLVSQSNIESIIFTTPSTFYDIWVRFDIGNNKSVEAGTLYPTIQLAEDTYDEYTEGAMTNQQLTEKVTGIINAATNAADFAAFKTAISAL